MPVGGGLVSAFAAWWLLDELSFDDETDSDVRRNGDRRLTVGQLEQTSARVLVRPSVQHNCIQTIIIDVLLLCNLTGVA